MNKEHYYFVVGIGVGTLYMAIAMMYEAPISRQIFIETSILMVDKYIEDISKVPEITKPGCKEVLKACEYERPSNYLRTGR